MVDVKLKGFKCRTTFQVLLNLNVKVIIGNDFLHKHGIDILYSRKVVQVNNQLIPFKQSTQQSIYGIKELWKIKDNVVDEETYPSNWDNEVDNGIIKHNGVHENDNEEFDESKIKFGEELSVEDKDKILEVILKHKSVFRTTLDVRAHRKEFPFQLTFDVNESLHKQPFIHKLPQSHIGPVTTQLEDQIERGILVPSDYHISHPILLVPKKDAKDLFE